MRSYTMSIPPSPPAEDIFTNVTMAMETASRVLKTQGDAITSLSKFFTDPNEDNGPATCFCHSLNLLRQIVLRGGKIVFSGMGKSHKIGSKLVATLHSFGIPAASLHPSDALHGDMGLVTSKDIIVFISASGNSPELFALLRHLPEGLPTVCLTCDQHSPLAKSSTGIIAAPVQNNHREQAIYGLPAPTITTTLCLAIGDAMCIALHESLEQNEKLRRANFRRWHPGGAIGMANGATENSNSDLAIIPWSSIPIIASPLDETEELILWKSVALSPYILAGNFFYKSNDVIRALEAKIPLSKLIGQSLNMAPSSRGSGLCVFRNSDNIPTGVVWD